jgi:hypothetical protein
MRKRKPQAPRVRPTENDTERETQVTQLIVRLDRLVKEAAKLREDLARLNPRGRPPQTT